MAPRYWRNQHNYQIKNESVYLISKETTVQYRYSSCSIGSIKRQDCVHVLVYRRIFKQQTNQIPPHFFWFFDHLKNSVEGERVVPLKDVEEETCKQVDTLPAAAATQPTPTLGNTQPDDNFTIFTPLAPYKKKKRRAYTELGSAKEIPSGGEWIREERTGIDSSENRHALSKCSDTTTATCPPSITTALEDQLIGPNR